MNDRHIPEQITPDCIVQGIIDRHRQTIVVFARHGLQCVGCYIAPFHTIADSAREHAVALESLLTDLNQALAVMDVARKETT
jgi:hybrid cluster-associated redox disulfide protein